MNKRKLTSGIIRAQPMLVTRGVYTGLWSVVYDDNMWTRFAGPWKTKREAVEFLRAKESDATDD